jgi:hypothetical protein
VAVLTDHNGTVWSIKRRWWSFPDFLNLLGWVGDLIGVLFMILWPFWLLSKFCGVRWVITINRDGERVGKERVRGWKNSKLRMEAIAQEVAAGDYSGPDSEPQSGPESELPPGTIVY